MLYSRYVSSKCNTAVNKVNYYNHSKMNVQTLK